MNGWMYGCSQKTVLTTAGPGHLAAGSGQLLEVGVYEEEVLGLLLTEEDKKKMGSLQTAPGQGLGPGLAAGIGPDRSQPLPPPPLPLLSPPPPPPPPSRDTRGTHPPLPSYLHSTTTSCGAKRLSTRQTQGIPSHPTANIYPFVIERVI